MSCHALCRFPTHLRGTRTHLQRLHSPPGIHRLSPQGGGAHEPPHEEDHPQDAARLEPHGHGDGVGDGHRHGPRRR